MLCQTAMYGVFLKSKNNFANKEYKNPRFSDRGFLVSICSAGWHVRAWAGNLAHIQAFRFVHPRQVPFLTE